MLSLACIIAILISYGIHYNNIASGLTSNLTNPLSNVRFSEESRSSSCRHAEGVITCDVCSPGGMLSQPHEAGAGHETDLTTPELEASNPIKYAELRLEHRAGPIRGTKKKVNYVEVYPHT